MSGIADSVGSILGSALSGGGLGSIASASAELLKLINNLTKDDPVKQAAAIREFHIALGEFIKKVREVKPGEDISDLVAAFTELLNK